MSTITTITFESLQACNVVDKEKKCRYSIVRSWNCQKEKATIIMYNPRTLEPNPFILGQSLSKCINFVIKDGDYGAIEVVNLFARISNSQKELEKEYKVFDELNFKYIKDAVESSSMVVLAWGKKGGRVSRNKKFINLIMNYQGKLKCFDIYDNKQPQYPRKLSIEASLKDCYMDSRGNIHILNIGINTAETFR
ncbi:DUF1643 domain-containing protein [Priestia megaterium]|uniref:DUF1643 domain-containing protein n=1 Tax=Priestia megaterium TaxID=1404 RepID=UPI000BFA2E5D|nr:DUF1643 domain-containing protein [Priestia megaterium]PFR94859.1 hypothetical protein COK39_15100 [Priestia megaterium]